MEMGCAPAKRAAELQTNKSDPNLSKSMLSAVSQGNATYALLLDLATCSMGALAWESNGEGCIQDSSIDRLRS